MAWNALFAGIVLLAAGLWSGSCQADDTYRAGNSVVFRERAIDQWRTNRIIVKWRSSGVAALQIDRVEDRAARLSQSSGMHFSPARNLFGRTDVMLLDYTPTHSEMEEILVRLNADPAIEYAEPDEMRFIQQFPTTLPNDPHFYASTDPFNTNGTPQNPDLAIGSWVGQWYLLPSSPATPAAISVTTAWAMPLPSPALLLGQGVRIAIIDDGIEQDHADLVMNMLPPGYDFVSCDQGNFQSTTTTALGATQGIDQCTADEGVATYAYSNDATLPGATASDLNWHADGSDPGDYIDTNDIALTEFIQLGCTTTTPSSWHGTKVAGILAARADNAIGIAGVAPMASLMSVRVAGTCRGALVSDLSAAILWAAGQAVTVSTGTIAASPAAQIINISLGAATACSATEQDAINAAANAGVLVIAAAGNEGGAIDAPANCTSVVSVVGLRHTGDKAPFSNLSSTTLAASIAAPAGDCVNTLVTQPCLYDIESTTDASETTPSNEAKVPTTPDFYIYSLFNTDYLNTNGTNQLNEGINNLGTSFAAPMVSGVAALMLAANPKLTPGQILARLQSSALPFPTTSPDSSPKPAPCLLADEQTASGTTTTTTTGTECICTTLTCGAGMLNAAGALTAASEAFVQITPSSTSGLPGQKISLNGSGSEAALGRTITTYQWTTDPATSDQLINPNEANATLVVPSFRSIGVTLTITDDKGVQTSGSVQITSALDPDHKGGALQPGWLALLAALAIWRISRRRTAAAHRQ